MQQSDFEEFSQVVNAAAELYGKPMSPMVLALWWGALKPYDLAAVREGLSRHMQNPDTGQFMPKPADVIKFIGGTTQDGALIAWAKADRALRTVGTYQSVTFDDPTINAVLQDMGGWISLGTKTEDEWPFVAKEFENRYRGYRLRGEFEYPKWLPGIAEAHNAQNAQRIAPPVLIGDEKLAKQVLLGGTNKQRIGFNQLDEQSFKEVLMLPEPVEAQA